MTSKVQVGTENLNPAIDHHLRLSKIADQQDECPDFCWESGNTGTEPEPEDKTLEVQEPPQI
jgi:hypothetical protein